MLLLGYIFIIIFVYARKHPEGYKPILETRYGCELVNSYVDEAVEWLEVWVITNKTVA